MGLIDKIKSGKKFLQLQTWAKESSLPGFSGVAVWDVGRLMYFELIYGNLTVRANAMAFSFFLSLFPALISLIILIPYIPIQYFDSILYSYLFEFLPPSAEEWINTTMHDLSSIPRGGLLSLSTILMLYFASNGVASMMTGFQKTYDASFKNRNFIQTRFTALWLTLLLFMAMISAAVLLVASNFLLDYLLTYVLHAQNLGFLTNWLNWLITVFAFYSLIALIYQYAPAFKIKPGFFSPGTVLATFLFVVTSAGFAFYVANFASYNKVYGSIGAVIVLLVWMELNCMILLLGFEINASIALNRDMGSITDYDSYISYRLSDQNS